MYQVSKSFELVNGKVNYYGHSDVYFAYYNGNTWLDDIPKKDNSSNLIYDHAECDNDATVEWDYDLWAPKVKNLTKAKTRCSLYFKTGKKYSITNLINNGSYEQPYIQTTYDWKLNTYTIITSEKAYQGSKSLKFNANAAPAMTTQNLNITAPKLNHIYYASLMFWSPVGFTSTDARLNWWNSDNDETGVLTFLQKRISTNNNWQKFSGTDSMTNETNLQKTWYIRNFVVNGNYATYCDNVLLIDLTEAFGSKNEPSKEWCDEHISYFEGTTYIYK